MLLLPAIASGMPQLDTIYCCDALTFLRAIPDNTFDMGISSPPYDGLRKYNGYSFDFEPIAREMYRTLRTGGVWVWVVGDATVKGSETLTSFAQALYFRNVVGFNMWDTMIFQKNGSSPNVHHPRYLQEFEFMFVLSKGTPRTWNPIMRIGSGGSRAVAKTKTQKNGDKRAYGGKTKEFRDPCPISNIWSFNVGAASGDDLVAFNHPAVFPERLVEQHILTWSNHNDVVCDIFMGSGTTAKVARSLDRRWVGCDISQKYVDLAKERLRNTDPFQTRDVATGIKQPSLFNMSA